MLIVRIFIKISINFSIILSIGLLLIFSFTGTSQRTLHEIPQTKRSESIPLIWGQDMSSFGEWTQMNGDLNFDSDTIDFDVEIDHSLVSNGWTPSGFSTRTDFWAYEYDAYRYAGLYRAEPHLQDAEWELMTRIYFDPSHQGSIYSSGCGMQLYIYNENYDLMFLAELQDGSSSSNDHRLFGRAFYYDANGDIHTLIDTSRELSDYDINYDYFGIKINATDNIYVYFPDKVPDGSGRLTTLESNARARGTMTYIVLRWYKWYEAPIDAHWSEIKFFGIHNDLSTSTVADTSSTTSSSIPTQPSSITTPTTISSLTSSSSTTSSGVPTPRITSHGWVFTIVSMLVISAVLHLRRNKII